MPNIKTCTSYDCNLFCSLRHCSYLSYNSIETHCNSQGWEKHVFFEKKTTWVLLFF